MVAIAAAFITWYKFRDHILFFQQAAEKMQQEYGLYQSGRKHYTYLGIGASLDLLMDKIDELRQEQNEKSLKIGKIEEAQDQTINDLAKVYKK